MKTVIGLTGKKQSGKNTAASFLVGFTEVSFADPMRDMMNYFCSIPADFDYDTQKEENVLELIQSTLLRKRVSAKLTAFFGHDNPQYTMSLIDMLNNNFGTEPFSARNFLQVLGTEWGRNTIDEDLWLNYAEDTARAAEGDVVFTDVRFDNEAERIQTELGGHMIEMVRTGDYEGMENDSHASEAGVDEMYIDYVISAKNVKEIETQLAKITGIKKPNIITSTINKIFKKKKKEE